MGPQQYVISRSHLYLLIAGTCLIGLGLFGLGFMAGRISQTVVAPVPASSPIATQTAALNPKSDQSITAQPTKPSALLTPSPTAKRDVADSSAAAVNQQDSSTPIEQSQEQATIQIAASKTREGAESLARKLTSDGIAAFVEQSGNPSDRYPYLIKSGPFTDGKELEKYLTLLKKKGYKPLVLRKR